tara:strand:+ start:2582 stop:3940 length:1359 start_codon:yes stop_codon:yes gene_type:complete
MRIHFIAIGGAAMHNLAIALKNKNYIVSGSDDIINDPSKSRLMKHGLLPAKYGWNAENISKELDAVILGMHAKTDNPELLRARELEIKIFSYPEFIFNQSKNKFRVVIGGSHGKTTITSMILHVMNFNNIDVDYMVGAQLKGFDVMVKITEENKFIILEGDEYLTSPIDLRPKFHLYKPDLALISGIAWDHINVFPTYDIYLEQFKIFIDSIQEKGTLIYNSDDIDLNKIVNKSINRINKIPYNTPAYSVNNNVTYLKANNREIPLMIFGEHNLNNLMGAKSVCQQMGIDEDSFFRAITSFEGASNRLELICKNLDSIAYKDFAHSPSKVMATTSAVRSQNPNKKIVACLELHTYSSLNIDFITAYHNALSSVDQAIIFYSQKALKLKEMKDLEESDIKKAFNHNNLIVINNVNDLINYLSSLEYSNLALLMMSSGKFEGMDLGLISDLMNK